MEKKIPTHQVAIGCVVQESYELVPACTAGAVPGGSDGNLLYVCARLVRCLGDQLA